MTTLRVSKPSGSGYAVHWTALLAQQLGYYAAEDLAVEIVELDQEAGTAALLSGETPVMRRGPDETMVLIDRGEPVHIVAGLIVKAPIYLYAEPQIRRIAELRGKTLAGISTRFGSTLVVRMLLDDEGLATSDYTIVAAGGSYARFAAMQSGSAAAAVLSPPTNARAEAAGFRLLENVPERYPAFMYSAIQVQDAFARNHPDVIARLLVTELRAQRYLNDPANRQQCIAMLAASDGLSTRDATTIYDVMVARDHVYTQAGEITGGALEAVLAAMVRYGEVRPALRLDACYDARYLEEARAALAAR